MSKQGQLLFLPLAGRVTRCLRCGEPCKVAETTREDARLLRHAEKPAGQCVNCAVSELFYVIGLRGLVRDVKMLALPHIQQQFAAVMKSGCADAAPSELDWTKIARNWDLPFPGPGGRTITPPPASAATGNMDPPDLRRPRGPRRSKGGAS